MPCASPRLPPAALLLPLLIISLGACTTTTFQEPETNTQSQGERPSEPDPSDPTNIDARFGAGYKYSDLTNSAELHELRTKLALIMGPAGIFTMDIGAGGWSMPRPTTMSSA